MHASGVTDRAQCWDVGITGRSPRPEPPQGDVLEGAGHTGSRGVGQWPQAQGESLPSVPRSLTPRPVHVQELSSGDTCLRVESIPGPFGLQGDTLATEPPRPGPCTVFLEAGTLSEGQAEQKKLGRPGGCLPARPPPSSRAAGGSLRGRGRSGREGSVAEEAGTTVPGDKLHLPGRTPSSHSTPPTPGPGSSGRKEGVWDQIPPQEERSHWAAGPSPRPVGRRAKGVN